MRQDEHLVEVGVGVLAGGVVADRVAGNLEVVMLACAPVGLAVIDDLLVLVENPLNVAVPVNHLQVEGVLVSELSLTRTTVGDEVAARKHLGREAAEVLPHTNDVAVHVDEDAANTRARKEGVAASGLFGVVERYASRMNCWTSHLTSPFHYSAGRFRVIPI